MANPHLAAAHPPSTAEFEWNKNEEDNLGPVGRQPANTGWLC